MSKKKRKRLSPELKIKALQDHIIEKLPVSEVCEQMGIQPSAFYLWQRELFARGNFNGLPDSSPLYQIGGE